MKNNTIDIENVNFDNFKIQKKEITVNGKKLPLSIGDKLQLSETDKFVKTVTAITVLEDNRIQYMLEWYDPESSNFCNESVTLTELKLLQIANAKKIKDVIGF